MIDTNDSFRRTEKYVKAIIKIHVLSRINKLLRMIKSASLPQSLNELPYDRLFALNIPTYDKSGQAVHPDILYRPENSHPFMLAFTPYPFSIGRFENPSLALSDNGLRFFEEYPGLNPLAAAPPRDHNNDPDMFYYNGQLRMVYLETLRPEKQNLVLLTRSGETSWSSRIVHTDYFDAGDPMIVSPAYVRIHRQDYLFYVNTSYAPNRIQFVAIHENFAPDFSVRQDIAINMQGLTPWHIDIIPYEDFFYMLICCVKTEKNNRKYDLYIARSNNGFIWDFSAQMLMQNTYRSTGFFTENDMYIYYSKQTRFFLSWEIGVVRKQNLKKWSYANSNNRKLLPVDF
jgi:hypothetical protein